LFNLGDRILLKLVKGTKDGLLETRGGLIGRLALRFEEIALGFLTQ